MDYREMKKRLAALKAKRSALEEAIKAMRRLSGLYSDELRRTSGRLDKGTRRRRGGSLAP